jgi:hypothetical protein
MSVVPSGCECCAAIRMEVLARVAHYPLAVTGKGRRSIRNRDQLVAAKEVVMTPRIREAVAQSAFETVFVRDKRMMLGEGAVWIILDRTGFGVGAINRNERHRTYRISR